MEEYKDLNKIRQKKIEKLTLETFVEKLHNKTIK